MADEAGAAEDGSSSGAKEPVAGGSAQGAQKAAAGGARGEEEEEHSAAMMLPLIIYHLFEDPTFFQKGIFGDGMGQSNARGRPLKLLSHIIVHVINALIFISTVSFCVESVPMYSRDWDLNPESWKEWRSRWELIELVCVIGFSSDVFIRFCGAASAGPQYAKAFLSDIMNLIDILAIAPWYAALLFGDIIDLRFLRVCRLVRILKTLPGARHGNMIGLISDILTTSYEPLFIPVFFMFISIIVISAVMYLIEQPDYQICELGDGNQIRGWIPEREAYGYLQEGSDGVFVGKGKQPEFQDMDQAPGDDRYRFMYNAGCLTDMACICPGSVSFVTYDKEIWSSELFYSIPHVAWWCIVTFTTVGYGDISPRTPLGQIWCCVAMIIGIFFLAMPITIVGDGFTYTWNKYSANKAKNLLEESRDEEAKEKLARKAAGEVSASDVCDHRQDDLNELIVAYIANAKENLSNYPEQDATAWQEALVELESCESEWGGLYKDLRVAVS